MPFQNVIMPEVTASEMRGVMALLALIGNPQAQVAADFLARLSAEKDAAVDATRQATADKAEAAILATGAKEHHDAIEGRLAKMDTELRAKVAAHVTAAEALAQREDDLKHKQMLHASGVAGFQKELDAARTSHEVREAALIEREQNLADAHLDIERRTEEFNKHMAPVLAAAALAR